MRESKLATLFRWATVAWVLATLILLGMPSSAIPVRGLPISDKVAHFLIFTCGSFLAAGGWPHRFLKAVGMVLLFAFLAELWQLILPTHRHPDAEDTLANVAGVILGSGIARLSPGLSGRRT